MLPDTYEAATRQVAVVAAFTDAASAPRVSGLFAEGRVETGESQALTLPDGAIVRTADNTLVWRVQGLQLAKAVVRLGERDARSGQWPVLSGVAAGDRILRNPGGQLVDGQKIEFAAVASAASAAAK